MSPESIMTKRRLVPAIALCAVIAALLWIAPSTTSEDTTPAATYRFNENASCA